MGKTIIPHSTSPLYKKFRKEMVAEASKRMASVTQTALRHGMSPGCLLAWCKADLPSRDLQRVLHRHLSPKPLPKNPKGVGMRKLDRVASGATRKKVLQKTATPKVSKVFMDKLAKAAGVPVSAERIDARKAFLRSLPDYSSEQLFSTATHILEHLQSRS